MDKKKQIKEITKLLCADFGNGCADCPFSLYDKCAPKVLAEDIYNADFRKQSEGEWIKATPYSQEYCNQCRLTPKTIFGKLPPFCPNCGAKMKGGAE